MSHENINGLANKAMIGGSMARDESLLLLMDE